MLAFGPHTMTAWLATPSQVPAELMKFGTAVKKKESKLYGAHFKDIDLSAKAKKTTFDSDED